MGANAAVNPDDSDTIQWRRDASTSTAVRLCWSLGVGTFFAAISIVAFWRVYDLSGQALPWLQPVLLALAAAVAVTVLALATTGNTKGTLETLTRRLPVSSPSGTALVRAMDAAVGTVVMGVVIVGLLLGGRLVTRTGALDPVGATPFTGAVALLIPLALVALVFSSFLRSAGALDRDDATLYLFDPEQAVDLATIDAVSSRQFGGVVVLKLRYAQPDGRYVPGPRRIVVPPSVAAEIERAVASES
ncbi:hypothetical protein [Natrarchaeobius chitinivorans]|uniref:Uncharacterized protein n=1 Tax=Natrarchaeobius chitinivorans TaxID=1679083 RepID=A0A3N6M2M8_NATCH|nr:hypothetical protein [Natrarchaeobius chitinivorans]RQG94664.1 hypothetical protein EA473_11330 [Natrarchaeobius chitinivorans]